MEKARQEALDNAIAELLSTEIDEIDTEGLSALYLSARQLADKVDTEASAPLVELKKKVVEAEKATLPLRKRAKALVDAVSERLETAYSEVQSAIETATTDALSKNDMETLAIIPDAPELVAGVSFAELKVVEITDVNAIPREYMIPDEKYIKAALSNGGTLPGVRMTTKRSWRRASEKGSK